MWPNGLVRMRIDAARFSLCITNRQTAELSPLELKLRCYRWGDVRHLTLLANLGARVVMTGSIRDGQE